MHDEAGLVLLGLHVPQFLEADAIHLRIGAVAQPVARLELAPELAAAAFGEERVLAVELHAGLIGPGLLALLVDAHVARRDALDLVAFVEDFGRGEAGEDLDARGLRLFSKPARDVAQAHHVHAVVLEAGRQHERRRAYRAVLAQEQEPVLGDRGIEGRALRLPVGQELVQRAGIHHGARQDVGADLRALFHHAHRNVAVDLLRADRGGEAGRAGADDDDVVLHRFARHVGNYNQRPMSAKKLVHVERIAIRWGDMDAMGHVNNTVYFRYMEQARISWFDALLPRGEAWKATGIVIANATCNFKRAINYPGTVEGHGFSGAPGGSSAPTV